MRSALRIAALAAACFTSACVSFDRYVVVQNQPLSTPQEAVVRSDHKITLDDGRAIWFDAPLAEVKTGQEIEVEVVASDEATRNVTVYFKRQVPVAQNWKAGPELEIPFSIHRIPAFERALLGTGKQMPYTSRKTHGHE